MPDVTISSQDAIAKLAGCTELHSITIRTGAPLDLAPLAALTTLTGDLRVGPTVALEELRLDGLREVRGTIEIASNSLLRGVFLPQLVKAARITIAANSTLATISAGRLATVTEAFAITDLGSLEILDLSALATVGGAFAITNNPMLSLIEMPALATVGALTVHGNSKLPAEQAAALRSRSLAPASE